jgi:hypothetical protein
MCIHAYMCVCMMCYDSPFFKRQSVICMHVCMYACAYIYVYIYIYIVHESRLLRDRSEYICMYVLYIYM